jgi:hypothetical protein
MSLIMGHFVGKYRKIPEKTNKKVMNIGKFVTNISNLARAY